MKRNGTSPAVEFVNVKYFLNHCYRELPTFLYVMPFSKTRIFVEETSLVARPAIGFDELKERLDRRLRHLGVKIKTVEEEEFCLIPMGGTLPKLPQRVLGIGGTGGMVHPSTGDATSSTASRLSIGDFKTNSYS